MEETSEEPNSILVPPTELGFDIVHGVNIEDVTQPLVFYWNRKNAVQGMKRQKKWLFLFGSILVAILSAPLFLQIHHHPITMIVHVAFILFFIVYLVLLYLFTSACARRDFTQTLEPIMEIRQEGLTIRCPGRNFELIPWDEIKEIRAFNLLWRFVGIVPVDLEKTLQHTRKDKSQLGRPLEIAMLGTKNIARLNSVTQPLMKLFGIFSPAIQIPEHWLPLSADEIVEILNERRSQALSLPSEGRPILELD